MSLRGRFFAATYDRQLANTERAGLRALRQQLLATAAGDALEIGGGTGANLPFYGEKVQSLTVTEPEAPMLRRLERRAKEHAPHAMVLRPGGQLLLIEHVRSDDAKLARRQDRMNPVNRFVVHCECNRPTFTTIQQAGFTVTQIEHQTMRKVLSFVSPLIVGIATASLEVDAGTDDVVLSR